MSKMRKWVVVLLAVLMLCTPTMEVSAATYSTVDAFGDCTSIKGLQGAEVNYYYGGLQHNLMNLYLDEFIRSPDSLWATKGWIAPYEFEGETFYFAPPDGWGYIGLSNRSNMSISIVFLLRWTQDGYGNDSAFLIDQGSLEGGHNYYAPNTDQSTYGGRAYRAFWHWLMEYLTEHNLHIDNFILGNEVNMPNQWHYSGTTDAGALTAKYADAYWLMYSAVRQHSSIPRCSVSVDHSWNDNDEGRGVAVRDYLNYFDQSLQRYGSNIDWSVSVHPYPGLLFNPAIWTSPYGLATQSPDTKMIDGTNLNIMTDYIRDNFGSEHRVMLTELGFTDDQGELVQAAGLAYTYYAAMYNPMVDCFLLNIQDAGTVDFDGGTHSMNFDIDGKLAQEVYTKIGNGNAADQQWIADVCLPVIGVSSWEEIIPNYGQPVDKASINAEYVGNINSELISFDLKQADNGGYYLTGQIVVVEWVNDVSTVPSVAPYMTFKSTDGTESIEVFVTPTGTNTYYFDRFIEGLSPDKEYVFEITSGSEKNISEYKSMNVSLATSPKMVPIKNLGKLNDQKLSYYMADNGELRLYRRNAEYVGNINSELKKTELVTGPNGNYVSGEIVVVEWENGVSTVPFETPIMEFMSTDGTELLPVFVTPTGTNTYYFDRSLGDMDVTKEYVFTIASGDEMNISEYRSMIVTTAAMEAKEGTLWESATQYVNYRTDPNTGELRVYAVNK